MRYLSAFLLLLLFIFGVIVTSAGADTEPTISGLTIAPEPASILLFGIGLVGLAGLGRKKLKK